MRFFIFLLLLFSSISNANSTQYLNTPSQSQIKKMHEHNLRIAGKYSYLKDLDFFRSIRPFSETEEARYIIFSDLTNFSSQNVKDTIAKNLPYGVELVVYTTTLDQRHIERLKRYYSQLAGDFNLVHVIPIISSAFHFWARDALPIPLIDRDTDTLELVDARYYYQFEPDQQIATRFDSPLKSHSYYFEGGNLVANSQGTCIIVDNHRAKTIPDDMFLFNYGCLQLIRLPHLSGIGHVDERVRFLTDSTVMTDTPEYVETLKNEGLQIELVGKPNIQYGTYINSLLVNGTVFVPIFNNYQDEQILELYRSYGFTAIGINTRKLVKGLGSIHCITMSYPEARFIEY